MCIVRGSPSWQLARDDLSYFSSNEYFTTWLPGVAWSLRADYLHKCLDCCLSACLAWYNWHSLLLSKSAPGGCPMSNCRKLLYKVIYNVMSYCDDTKLPTRWQMSLSHCTRFYKLYEKSLDVPDRDRHCLWPFRAKFLCGIPTSKYCYDVSGGLVVWWYMVRRNT